MSKYQKILLCCVLLLVVGCVAGYFRAVAPIAQPIMRLVFGSRDCPVDGLGGVDFPSKGFNRASLAAGQDGKFYVLTNNQNPKEKEPVIHVLTADTGRNVKRAVPLRRQDGRLMRYLCYFLSVSPTGRRWWTARRPHESEADLREGNHPKAILTVHDESGKGLQEWVMTQAIDDVILVQAVGENKVYTIDGENQILVYEVGQQQPQKLSLPLIYTTAAAFATYEGNFVGLQGNNNGQVKALVTGSSLPSRVFTTFQWLPKGAFPSLFWYDPQEGLFIYEYLSGKDNNIRLDRAKSVYRITLDGQVHKLFETPNVLQAKPGQQVRAGQLLKADAHFVWMEATYLKDGKVTEYQIVKVPIS